MTETVSLDGLNTEAVRSDPYAFYADLHRRGPVCAVESGRYAFVVHGYDACDQVMRSPAFKVNDFTHLDEYPSWEKNRTQAIFANSMFFTNAPRHTRMRGMFQRTFTPRRVVGLDPAVQQIASSLLDRMALLSSDGSPVDLMSSYAFPLPANVLGELLGVPEEDREWYRPRADALGRVIELGGSTPENLAIADKAGREITDYFLDLARRRRAEPKDDLISALMEALESDGGQLNEEELLANLVVVFNAGFVSTTHLLGNGLVLLLDRPAYLSALLADMSLAPSYVEEILRMEVPTHFSVRFAAEDTSVAGTDIPAGSWVLVLLAAANRDPNKFPSPEVFDPDREVTSTLSFGGGPHYCIGAALARMEGVRGLGMLLERFPKLSLAKRPGTPRQLMLRGYDDLWLSLA
jgi:cytochrome P450